jgi:hypothetical protein
MNIQFDSDTQTVKVDGARFSLEVLATLAHPDTLRYYRFVRVGETVFVNSYAAIGEEPERFSAGFREYRDDGARG